MRTMKQCKENIKKNEEEMTATMANNKNKTLKNKLLVMRVTVIPIVVGTLG